MRSGVYIVNEPQPDADSSSYYGEYNQDLFYTMENEQQQVPTEAELNPSEQEPEANNVAPSAPEVPDDGDKEVEEIDDLHENDVVENVNSENDPEVEIQIPPQDGNAPLAEQERVSGLTVPPPSPMESNTDEDPKPLIDIDDETNKEEIEELPVQEKEDIVFIEHEQVPLNASTPKKEKKDKKAKEVKVKEKEKKSKEKKPKKPKAPKTPKPPKPPRKPFFDFQVPPLYK